MKIVVLEHPRIASKTRFNDIANTPLWSCLMGGYAAASLEQAGFETVFLDDSFQGRTFAQTKETLLSLAPDLIAINTVYFWEHTPALFDMIFEIRASGFSGHINLFGFFPTLVYRKILEAYPQVDSICVGEFEKTLVELAGAFENHKSPETVQGLATASCLTNRDSRMRTPEKNPDHFPFPKRSTLNGTVSILASRGCYNHCSFCPVPSFYNQGSLWRGRSPENIAAEITELMEQGVSSFYFCDPNFIGPGTRGKKRINDLMDLIRPMNIRFGMETRPQDLDDEILTTLVGSGFESLLMGVESASPKILARIDKSSGPEQASRAIELCRRHGIEPEIGFLMFVHDSSLEDLRANMTFLSENTLLDRLDRTANLLSHTQIVLAGTTGYNRFESEGKLIPHGIFGFEGTVGFSDSRVGWVANLMTTACHAFLKSMSDRRSPIYWKDEDPVASEKANAYLVDLAATLIHQAENISESVSRSAEQTRASEILADINVLIAHHGNKMQ